MDLEDEDRYDTCRGCGSYDFFYDVVAYEASCRQCGLVNSFETDYVIDYRKPKTYFKHNYFSHSILMGAMKVGFKISRQDMTEFERMYKVVVDRFYELEPYHKRKNMISAKFVLWKLAPLLGYDVSPYIKLPKKQTLAKLERMWNVLNPFD